MVSKSVPHACLQEAMCDCVEWLVYITCFPVFTPETLWVTSVMETRYILQVS